MLHCTIWNTPVYTGQGRKEESDQLLQRNPVLLAGTCSTDALGCASPAYLATLPCVPEAAATVIVVLVAAAQHDGICSFGVISPAAQKVAHWMSMQSMLQQSEGAHTGMAADVVAKSLQAEPLPGHTSS